MLMRFLTHVYCLTGKLTEGQNLLTRYVTTSDPKATDYKTSDGAVLDSNQIDQMLSNAVIRPLRPVPIEIGAHKNLLVNCVGGVYLVDEDYETKRELMKPIGDLLMTDKHLLAPAA